MSRLASPFAWRCAHTLMALWIGMMIANAFVAAPLVFGSVDEYIATKDHAARVIGPSFGRIDMVGVLACLLFLGALRVREGRFSWRAWLTGLLLAGAAADAFYIAPQITARVEPLRVFHGIATTIWMTAILAGLLLVLSPTPRAPAQRLS